MSSVQWNAQGEERIWGIHPPPQTQQEMSYFLFQMNMMIFTKVVFEYRYQGYVFLCSGRCLKTSPFGTGFPSLNGNPEYLPGSASIKIYEVTGVLIITVTIFLKLNIYPFDTNYLTLNNCLKITLHHPFFHTEVYLST